MKRRTVLQALAGGVAGAPLLSQAMATARRARMGKGGNLKKLVVLFQRGGNDGLNTLVPIDSYEYVRYRNLRPTIRIERDRAITIPGENFFGLHPGLAPLLPIMTAGNLSLVHAVGYPQPDRSHFESQSYFETAVPGNGLMDGWLNRLLVNSTGPGVIRGVAVGNNIPQSVTGPIAVPVSENFGNSSIDYDNALNDNEELVYEQRLRDLFALNPGANNASLYEAGNKIFQMIDGFSSRNRNDYVPENGALYPDSGLGRRVMHTAQMLKDDNSFLGVEVVTLNQGGYDTHANQTDAVNSVAGQHFRLLNDLALSMAAFYTDMGPTRMEDIMFMVVSEFGRRAYQNDSVGTDHGTGGVVFLMGGGVSGQTHNGGSDWPGLDDHKLLQGDDLMWATDFRDIYWEVMARHMGLSNQIMQAVVPGHTYTPVGAIL